MLNIQNHVIGEKPYIIAEIGSNWQTKEDCLKSIQIAKACGADAVKFQVFNFKALYGLDRKYQPSWYEKKAELQIDWLNELKHEANNSRIHFLVSAFDTSLLQEVDRYVDAHKVASSKISDQRFLEKVGSFGKPVFLSTGASSQSEISLALSALGGSSVILNYCVSSYPAYNVDLFKIDELRTMAKFVGFSDHTRDYTYLPRAAITLHKAVSIEKHLCCINATTADSGHSLRPTEFKHMVDLIRGTKKTYIGPSKDEIDMILRHKDRLVATVDLKSGDILDYGGNYGSYRSMEPCSDTISPFRDVSGKAISRDIKAGECIRNTDII
jgi:sialic acid synthase SpsE